MDWNRERQRTKEQRPEWSERPAPWGLIWCCVDDWQPTNLIYTHTDLQRHKQTLRGGVLGWQIFFCVSLWTQRETHTLQAPTHSTDHHEWCMIWCWVCVPCVIRRAVSPAWSHHIYTANITTLYWKPERVHLLLVTITIHRYTHRDTHKREEEEEARLMRWSLTRPTTYLNPWSRPQTTQTHNTQHTLLLPPATAHIS